MGMTGVAVVGSIVGVPGNSVGTVDGGGPGSPVTGHPRGRVGVPFDLVGVATIGKRGVAHQHAKAGLRGRDRDMNSLQ